MATLYKGSRINSTLATTGPFPVVREEELEGSYRSVAQASDRLIIPLSRLKQGMLVWAISEAVLYRYISSTPATTNTIVDWEIVNLGGSGGDVITTTFSNLTTLYTNGQLSPGVWYRFMYTCVYTRPINSPTTIIVGPEEPIMVLAISPAAFAPIAYSTGYLLTELPAPVDSEVSGFTMDILYWEIFSGNAILDSHPNWSGKITRRIDTVFNISAPFDWRGITQARYPRTNESNIVYDNPYPGYSIDIASVPDGPYTGLVISGSIGTINITGEYRTYQDIALALALKLSFYGDSCKIVKGLSNDYIRINVMGSNTYSSLEFYDGTGTYHVYVPDIINTPQYYWTFGSDLLSNFGSRNPDNCKNIIIK